MAPNPPPSGPLRWAVQLLLVEAAAAAAVAVLLAYQAVAGEPADRGEGFAVVGFVVVVAAALGGLAAALRRRRPRARAPAIVLQLMAVMSAYMLATGGLIWLAGPLALLGIVVVTLLLTPSTSAALSSSGPSGAR